MFRLKKECIQLFSYKLEFKMFNHLSIILIYFITWYNKKYDGEVYMRREEEEEENEEWRIKKIRVTEQKQKQEKKKMI